MTETKVINQYVDTLYQREMKRANKQPERLAKLLADNPNALEDYRRRLMADAEELVSTMKSPEAYAFRIVQGALHPDNQATRILFQSITGITLPDSVQGSREAIAQTPYGEACNRLLANRERERREKEEAEERERIVAHNRRMDKITDCVRRGEPISADDLIDACRHYNIELHPRSVGCWRRYLVWVDKEKASLSYSGKKPNVDSAFIAYRALKELLFEPPLTEAEQSSLNHLFGVTK
jgi:hypothetical protein